MLGKLTWDAIPFDQPIPMIASGVVALAILAITMFFGLIPVLQHYAVRLVLWRREKVPLRLVDFLKEAARINLLRQVGGGFVFRHDSLRTYFRDGRQR